MAGLCVALRADGVAIYLRILVRTVTRQARELAAALQEAGAFTQVNGLVPYVPGVLEIRIRTGSHRHAVTLATKVVDTNCGQVLRVPNILSCRFGGMKRPGAMTRFAMHSGFRRVE